ncbi:hypothetical protein [Roseibium sediminis]|uniref:hypothetical protein n=1 Tax=Roseibium sediminis TaxID=1775174 RepID=UPI00123D3771|nr:hypothetical protein [Roseibium sediminis]
MVEADGIDLNSDGTVSVSTTVQGERWAIQVALLPGEMRELAFQLNSLANDIECDVERLSRLVVLRSEIAGSA